MADSEGDRAVPQATRQRLAAVLGHLAASSESRGSRARSHAAGSCGVAASACQSSEEGGGAAHDLEDLAGAAERPHLFDPKTFEETRKPVLQATNLPGQCYSSSTWLDREYERVFLPSWSLMGREDEISKPGSYLAIDTEWGGPVAVCRGTDDGLYAFANVCMHRGAKILQGSVGQGAKVGLVCPYHAWTYKYDGTLKWAPGMDKAENFDEDNVRLTPVRVDTFHGFVFVCCSETTPPLAEVLGDLADHMPQWFGPEGMVKDMVTVSRREYTVNCDWKFLMENTCETYHTSTVHKNSLGPMKSRPIDPHRGDWDAVVVPSERSVVPLPSDFPDEQFPLPSFADRTAFVNLFPSLQFNMTWDCMWWMRLFPLGVGRTHIQMGFCFPRTTVALERFPSVLEHYQKRWHIAVTEDNGISLNQQRGMRSRFRKRGRYGPLEFGTHNFNNWLISRMTDRGPAWDPGRRVFVGDGVAWSNDDARLLHTIEDAEKASKEDGGRSLVPVPLSRS